MRGQRSPNGTSVLAGLAVGALIVCSAVARTLAARPLEAPWIAPDEMVYGLIGRSFWETGHLDVLGVDAPFYGLYPLLAGLPGTLFGPTEGVHVLQAIQALLASVAGAIVYVWARPVAGARWALASAVLTVLVPSLAYSGLLMTESAFLITATLALWTMARALVHPTLLRQGVAGVAIMLALSMRLQGLVLVPVWVTAVGLAAWFARDAGFVRRFAPTLTVLAVLGVVWLGVHFANGSASALGAYGVTTSAGYDRGEAALWVFRHAGDLFLLVLGAPLIAMMTLAYEASWGRERDPRVRALVAIALSASVWLTLQVGVFASRFVGHLAERDLIAAAPPILACFGVWLSRGAPRPQPSTSFIACLVALPALLLPVRALFVPIAAPDAFMTIPLERLIAKTSPDTVALLWPAGVLIVVVLTVFLPRRATFILPALIGTAFVITSILTIKEIDARARADRKAFFGSASKSWVNHAAAGPVTYLYDGNRHWNAVWQYAFWNSRIRSVVNIGPVPGPGPIPGSRPARVRPSGLIVDARGHPLAEREVIASTVFTLVGKNVTGVHQGEELEQAGLRLWLTHGAPRLSTSTTGLRANGDISEPVTITIYACGRGRLQLTLIGKTARTSVEIGIDGKVALRQPLPAGAVRTISVPAPSHANGQTRCEYKLSSPATVGTAQIAFVRS